MRGEKGERRGRMDETRTEEVDGNINEFVSMYIFLLPAGVTRCQSG